jgi:hypothetical protein
MAMLSGAKQFLTEWIDAVSRAIDAVASRFVRPRRIRLVEGDDGMFRASTAPVKGKPSLSDVIFRRCLRTGRRRSAQADSRCSCRRRKS